MAEKYPEDTKSDEASQPPQIINQRQLSDSRALTTCYLLFENAGADYICFRPYRGTHSRNHQGSKLFIPQMTAYQATNSNEPSVEFANYLEQVLEEIPSNDLASYTVSIRTGVLYFSSRRFRFDRNYTLDNIQDALQKKIPLSDEQFYYPPRPNANPRSDDTLRSSFCNVKPINQPENFVKELDEHKFKVKDEKFVFRVYLQSADRQTHVCIIDPKSNYSIVEFSKDFQRTSNIDFVRDRSSSKFRQAGSYDDVFDYRIQFQYNPRTCNDQMDTIEYELHQQFPSLDKNFRNENLLEPIGTGDKELRISEQLSPYVTFIRRDFGDVYHYEGADELFQNFTIYLESSVEYNIDRQESICKPTLDTHGLVYARLDLATMISGNDIDRKLLIEKLWDMGMGLTTIAGNCTTAETQQGTNYYTMNGDTFTAEDEALVQRILKGRNLRFMLRLPNYAPAHAIHKEYDRITNQLHHKWNLIRSGSIARDKLRDTYEEFFRNRP